MIACSTRNAKYSATAVQCLHSLINFEGLPPDRLVEVLDALKEATHLGVEIHLKILQSLPSLIQNYGDYLSNNLIVELLLICYILQGGNKVPVVVNTALATLQQLIISVFDKVSKEDSLPTPLPKTFEVPIENNDKVLVSPAAYDALRVFFDICNLIERQKPVFLKFGHLPETVSLELIESILTSHSEIFSTHMEFRYVIRTRAVPLLLRAFSEKRDFPVTVRVTRILYLIIRRLLPILDVECEVILSLLTHMLDSDAAPYWKRVLCMEVFQGVSLEFSLIESIYAEFDGKEGRRPLIKGWITAIDKLSAEQPAVIGINNTSSTMDIPESPRQTNGSDTPTNSSSSSLTAVELSQIPGISTKTSLVRSSCIDLLDKTEPPNLPPSYLYYLALTCINSFSEGIARSVLSATSESNQNRRKHRTVAHHSMSSQSELYSAEIRSRSNSPRRTATSGTNSSGSNISPNSNATKRRNDVASEHLSLVASLLESTWSELLSCFTTFFRATMDNDLYHTLVRSAQKFTHASGVLLLLEPRDAYLTLLGKFTITLLEVEEKPSSSTGSKHGILSMEGLVGTLSPTITRDPTRLPFSHNSASTPTTSSGPNSNRQKLNSRNTLCFRALLNLGIALGPTLGSGWIIVLETLQYFDFLVYGATTDRRRGSSSKTNFEYNIETAPSPFSGLSSEFSTVESSTRRLLDSTKDYPSLAFNDLISSVGVLASKVLNIPSNDAEKIIPNISELGNISDCDPFFLLEFLGAICFRNSFRFVSMEEQNSRTWTTVSQFLISVEKSRNTESLSRIRACQVHNEIIRKNSLEYSTLQKDDSEQNTSKAQRLIFESLLEEVKSIVSLKLPSEGAISICSTEAKLHVTGIDYLNKLLDNCGGSLNDAWSIVFDIIDTVFNWLPQIQIDAESQNRRYLIDRSIQLLKSGFESLQLICNEYLDSLPPNCIIRLIDTLYGFCHQEGDLNISFTSLSFFWIISDFLRKIIVEKTEQDFSIDVTTTKQLAELSRIPTSEIDSLNSLWIILLLRLAAISYDPRPQVRNGAIQILFRIFDAQGLVLPPRVWKACQSIVLEKIMENDPFKTKNNRPLSHEQIKQWEETLGIIFNSIGNMYSTFLTVFIQDEPGFEKLWKQMLIYFQKFSTNGTLPVINAVYQSLNSILAGFIKSEVKMSSNSLDNSWEFWTSQPIIQNKQDATSAQDSYTSLCEVFTNLRALTPDQDFSSDRVSKTINLLKSCMAYPLLAPFYSDKDRLSPLQSQALKQLESINIATNLHTANLIISLYSDIIVKPFNLPEVSGEGYGDKGTAKLPTFVSLSQHCLELLEFKLKLVKPYISDLIQQGAMYKLTSALYTVLQHKLGAPFVTTATAKHKYGLEKPSKVVIHQLWELADLRFVEIVKASLPYITVKSKNSTNKNNIDENVQKLWGSFAKCTIAIMSPGKSSDSRYHNLSESVAHLPKLALPDGFVGTLQEYEAFDIEIYKTLMKLFLGTCSPGSTDKPSDPVSVAAAAPLSFWRSILQSLFLHSLIYDIPRLDPVIESFSPSILISSGDGPVSNNTEATTTTTTTKPKSPQTPGQVSLVAAKQVHWILNNTFFGSTDKLTFRARQSLAFTCLDDLAHVASSYSSSTSTSTSGSASSSQEIKSTTELIPSRVRNLANRFLTLRLAMILYLYITDHPLRGRAPMPKVQRCELLHVLKLAVETEVAVGTKGGGHGPIKNINSHLINDNGIENNDDYDGDDYNNDNDNDCSLVSLFPLFVRAIPIAEKDTKVLHLLHGLLLKIGKAHSIVN